MHFPPLNYATNNLDHPVYGGVNKAILVLANIVDLLFYANRSESQFVTKPPLVRYKHCLLRPMQAEKA